MKPSSQNFLLAGVAFLVALTVGAMSVTGHMATERFIPLGQSPGLSSKNSLIGTISAVDSSSRTVTVDGGAGAKIVSLTDRTKIWLDRSKLKQTNLVGNPSELRVGRRIEVKFATPDGPGVAGWIKVEITASN